MRRRFHPFLLIEVLIAIVLVSLCLVPLMTFPYKAVHKEKEALFSLEQERLLGVLFARALKGKGDLFSSEEFLKNGEDEIELDEVTLDLKKLKQVYLPRMKIELVKEEGEQSLAKCTIELCDKTGLGINGKKGSFFIFLKKNSL